MNNREKVLRKVAKTLSEEDRNSMTQRSAEELKNLIYEANRSTAEAKAELQANTAYRQILEDKKAMESGMKDLKKLNDAKIEYALLLLSDRGVE